MGGPVIRRLEELGELERARGLFDVIWEFEPGGDPLSVEALLTLTRCGNYVFGAFHGERMVGASVGIFGAPRSGEMCSYMTGASVIGAGTGLALKRHQRSWALERGVDRIFWTFDPLIRRNAHFNLVKLGARAEGYHVDYYGKMPDSINQDDESDRLMAVWRLNDTRVADSARGSFTAAAVPAGTEVVLEARDDRPVRHESTAENLLFQVPRDIERIRTEDLGLAREWRWALRESLGPVLEEGAAVTGFHDRTSYLVQRRGDRGTVTPSPSPVLAEDSPWRPSASGRSGRPRRRW